MIGLRDDQVLKLLHAYMVVSQKSIISHFGSIFHIRTFKVYSDKWPPLSSLNISQLKHSPKTAHYHNNTHVTTRVLNILILQYVIIVKCSKAKQSKAW